MGQDTYNISICYYRGKATDVVIAPHENCTITSIEKEAFRFNRDIKSVTICDEVKTIGHSAFMRCTNLTSVRLPSELKEIEPGLFEECESLENA